MTWQDELQKLDNELASGRISADEYRRRRDEVLSGSAGSGPAAPQPQQGGAPFAPPFKWQAQQPAAPTSDATQVVNVQNQPPSNPDATQVVTGGQQNRSQDAERTQFVAPIAPPPGPGGWGPPQQQQQVAPPPWVGGDFDQINQPGGWSHGPEVFDESSGSGKGKIIGIVLVVLVVVGIGFGAYWVWGRQVADPNSNLGSGAPTSSSTKPSPPPDPAQIGKLAGNPKQQTEITSFEDVEKLNPPYLTPNEMEAYKTAGGARAKLFVGTPAQGSSTTVMIVSASEESAANNCAIDLKNVQITNGMEAVTTDVPEKVNVTQVPPKDNAPARIRGHYSSKKYVVRVDVTAATLAEAMTLFKDALDNQLKAMPTDA